MHPAEFASKLDQLLNEASIARSRMAKVRAKLSEVRDLLTRMQQRGGEQTVQQPAPELLRQHLLEMNED